MSRPRNSSAGYYDIWGAWIERPPYLCPRCHEDTDRMNHPCETCMKRAKRLKERKYEVTRDPSPIHAFLHGRFSRDDIKLSRGSWVDGTEFSLVDGHTDAVIRAVGQGVDQRFVGVSGIFTLRNIRSLNSEPVLGA